MTPRLTVLTGPSAVGKGTVGAYIRTHYPSVWFSVSATTRQPRPGEIDGVHYHFLTPAEFDHMVKSGHMLESAVVHGRNQYGTPKAPVLEALKSGKYPLLEIDLAGARQVKERLPEARFIFLAPPSWDELVRRLVGRGTESAEEQARRLETAKVELAAESEFDHTVVNRSVSEAAEELVTLMGLSVDDYVESTEAPRTDQDGV